MNRTSTPSQMHPDAWHPSPQGGGSAVAFSLRHILALWTLLLLAPMLRAQDFDTTTHTAANPQTAQCTAANAAMDAHDYPKAVALLTPLAAENPKDAHLLYDLGAAEDALDQTAGAETSYRNAKADDPAFFEPRLALALLLARNGHLPESREELAAALTLPEAGTDPALRARAYRTLARIDQKDRPADARDELLAALKLSPETPDDTLLAAELAASAGNGAPAAEAAYRRLLSAHPNDPQSTAALAHLLIAQKRPAEAEPLLRSALAVNPSDPALGVQLASLLIAQDKPADALPVVAPLHAAHPDDLDITRLFADLNAATGNYGAAEQSYAGLSAKAPQDSTLLLDRADALIHLKRYTDAQTLLTRVLAQPAGLAKDSLGQAAGALAFAASENNDPAASLQALAVRATVLPPTPSTLFLAAIAQDKLHHTRQAQQAYKEFLAAANGSLPDQEFEARHRLVDLEHTK